MSAHRDSGRKGSEREVSCAVRACWGGFRLLRTEVVVSHGLPLDLRRSPKAAPPLPYPTPIYPIQSRRVGVAISNGCGGGGGLTKKADTGQAKTEE